MVYLVILNGKIYIILKIKVFEFSDFQQIYDVDYGFCYTFNSDAIYNTTQSGASHGLKMVVLSDINEYMATSSEQGIKIVVHPQDEYPFPNADGYRSAIGKEVDLRVTYVSF